MNARDIETCAARLVTPLSVRDTGGNFGLGLPPRAARMCCASVSAGRNRCPAIVVCGQPVYVNLVFSQLYLRKAPRGGAEYSVVEVAKQELEAEAGGATPAGPAPKCESSMQNRSPP